MTSAWAPNNEKSNGPVLIQPNQLAEENAWEQARSRAESDAGSPKYARPIKEGTPHKIETPVKIEVSGGTSGTGITSRFHKATSGLAASWQWEHRTGFRPYDQRTSEKIEYAFQRGECKVSVKSGKLGVRPLMIFFIDMVQFDPATENERKVQRIGGDTCCRQIQRYCLGWIVSAETGRPRRETLRSFKRRREMLNGMGTMQKLRAEVQDEMIMRRSVETLPSVKNACCERCTAFCKAIKSHPWFDLASMGLVFLNGIWIAIEADYNTKPTLYESAVGFQIMEQLFCVLFSIELAIRFGAFTVKSRCWQDPWFRFDVLLVSLMIIETWFLPIVLAVAGTSQEKNRGLSNLSVLRLARLVRLTRVTRLVRWAPELLTLLKGITTSLKSVAATYLLLGLLLFVFGIIFKTLDDLYPGLRKLGDFGQPFKTVKRSVWSLILHGLFLDEIAGLLNEMNNKAGDLCCLVFLIFVVLGTFTVLNMLIGFQCEVATRVGRQDKENAEVFYLRNSLTSILECYDKDGSGQIEKAEYLLILQDPEVHDILRRFGTATRDLQHMCEVIYDEKMEEQKRELEVIRKEFEKQGIDESELPSQGQPRLRFDEFIDLVLRLRGQHASRVTDIVDLREFIRTRLDGLRDLRQKRIAKLEAMGLDPSTMAQDNRQLGIRGAAVAPGTGDQVILGVPGGGASSTMLAASPTEDFSNAVPAWATEIISQLARLNDKVDKLEKAAAASASATTVDPSKAPSTEDSPAGTLEGTVDSNTERELFAA